MLKTIPLNLCKALLALLPILFMGCTRTVVITKTALPISTRKVSIPTLTATIPQVTFTPRMAASMLRATPTSLPISTLEPTSIQEMIPVCAGNGRPVPLPEGFTILGAIVYQDEYGYHTLDSSPQIQSQSLISEPRSPVNFGVSPDGLWLAYAPVSQQSTLTRFPTISGTVEITGTIVFETPNYVLLSATGERIEYDFNATDLTYANTAGYDWQLRRVIGYPDSYWINDHLLYITLFFDDPSDPYTRGRTRPKVLDAFTGKWLDEPFNNLYRFDGGNVGFSPDMSRALFEAKSKDQYSGMVLRDLAANEDTWADPGFSFRVRSVIRWSPDSSWAAIADIELVPQRQPIFLVSRDGLVKTITDSTFPVSGPIDIHWSPDSQYLALVLPDNGLYLYNIITEQYTCSCPLVAFGEGLPELIWSPDSRYVLLSAAGRPLQLLKVETGEVFELIKNANIVGWSDKFPVPRSQP